VHGRCLGAQRLDVAPENVEVPGGDHQLSCSLNDGDVDEERVIQEAACSASDFAPVFDALPLPSRHSFGFGLLDGTRAPQCYEQIKDTIIL